MSDLSFSLSGNTEDADAKLKIVSDRLKLLTDRAFNVRVGADDHDAMAKIKEVGLSLDRLNKRVAKPHVSVDGLSKADIQIDRLNAKLDRLGEKSVEVDVKVHKSLLSRLNPLNLEGAGGSSGGLLKLLSAGGQGLAGGSLTGAGAVGLAALIGGLIPSVATAGLGLGVGGLGALGAYKVGSSANKAISQLQTQLAHAKGQQKRAIEQQLAQEQKRYGGALNFYDASQGIVGSLSQSFLGALSSHGARMLNGNTAVGGAHSVTGDTFRQTQTPSFLQGLTGIFGQLGKFIKTLGPELGQMFRASLPTVKMFVGVMEQFAKLVLPAISSDLQTLKPDMPIFAQGFKFLSQGVAGFIRNLGGPGMKDSAIIFKATMDVIGHILSGSAIAFNGLAILLVDSVEAFKRWAHKVASMYDDFRHRTAVVFDGARHDIAHIWDMTWNDSIGAVVHFIEQFHTDVANWRHDISSTFDGIRHDISHYWDVIWNDSIGKVVHFIEQFHTDVANWRHDIANSFDSIRHDIASVWDSIWTNTINAVHRGEVAVLNWFKRMATDIFNDIRHLPGILFKLAGQMVNNLWKGAQQASGKVFSFFKGVGHGILNALHSVFHFGSPSKTMQQYGRWIVDGLAKGIQSRVGSLHGNIKAMGHNVVSWLTQALKITHKPMSWLPALERMVSLESGGSPIAHNASGASGLLQTKPGTFAEYSLGGSIWDPVANAVAAIRYLSSRYGSPFNIPGLFSGNYVGYWKGGWVNEPVIGMGMHSGSTYGFAEHGPEYVNPGGSGGGGDTLIVNCHPSNNPDEVAAVVWKGLRDLKRHRGGALGLA